MEPFRIKDIVSAVKGTFNDSPVNDVILKGISVDSRTASEGQLFVALRGECFDGHDYLDDAFAKGVKAAVVSLEKQYKFPVIKVRDSLAALGLIARWYRQRFDVQVVGISGSNGKTTTKEMIASLLSCQYKVVKSPASYNNFVGVPLTLFQIDKKVQVVVQEMETNVIGGISRLCNIAVPQVGVITNIGKTHLASLKSRAGVLQEKSELIHALPSEGVIILNRDDSCYVPLLKCAKKRRCITFGITNNAQYRAQHIHEHNEGISFLLNNRHRVYLNTRFFKNIYNALAAIATAVECFGLKEAQVAGVLEEFTFPPFRGQIIQWGTMKIVNDCFNANPDSMGEALKMLANLKMKRSIAVLGDMKELGRYKARYHRRIGHLCAQLKIDKVITVGEYGQWYAQGFFQNNKESEKIVTCNTLREVVEYLHNELRPYDGVLLKGSRTMKMERIIEALGVEDVASCNRIVNDG